MSGSVAADRVTGWPEMLYTVAGSRALVVAATPDGRDGRMGFVNEVLHGYGLSTLMLDRLTCAVASATSDDDEFEQLSARLSDVLRWIRAQPQWRAQSVGLLGAGPGGGAALVAAARHPDRVGAVVMRGGRPDLAGADLARVRAPTLLVVGALDGDMLGYSQAALRRLDCERRLEVVPGATRDFREPGALATLAHLAGVWFREHLVSDGMH